MWLNQGTEAGLYIKRTKVVYLRHKIIRMLINGKRIDFRKILFTLPVTPALVTYPNMRNRRRNLERSVATDDAKSGKI